MLVNAGVGPTSCRIAIKRRGALTCAGRLNPNFAAASSGLVAEERDSMFWGPMEFGF